MLNPCDLSRRFQILYWIAVCLVLIAVGITAYEGYTRFSSTAQGIQFVPDDTIVNISRQMVLPQNETPTIATVTDISQLQGSPFFEHAEIGDKIVVYIRAGLVILYSPTYERIVQVAPVYFGASSTTP